MEQTISKSISLPYVRPIVISVSVALAFWLLCVVTAGLSTSSIMTLKFGYTYKIANTLRALVIVSPAAVVGTGIGSLLWNITQGNFSAASPIMPIATTGVGLFLCGLSRRLGHTLFRDMLILVLYGCLHGILISSNYFALASVLSLNNVPLNLILIKMLTSSCIICAGYPLVVAWRKYVS
jgi:hypothetical protein